MMDKFEIIENEVNLYKNTLLEQNPTFAPKMGDIYKLIDLFTVSRFRDGDKDSLGYKKVFFNIVNFVVDVCAKMLDLDTKDIYLIAEDGASYWPSWMMGKELKLWMKDKYFGRQLNQYCREWAKYGDLWVKKVKDDVKWVPPQNMIYRVNATDYKTIPLIEKHEYGADELRIVGKQNGWDNIEETIKGSGITSQSPADYNTVGVEDITPGGIIIYEAWFPKGYLDEKNNWFVVSKDSNKILAEAQKDCPYKKLPWEQIPGRLPGRGRVEQLFEEQIYLNRIANYKSTGFHWTSKHLYQARPGSGIEKNLLSETDDGEILLTNSEITPVKNEERNLSAYGVDEERWYANALKRTFTTEPISGGQAKSGTPATSSLLQTQQATAFFKQKKEELGSFIKEILWDWILPQFADQKRKEHKILVETLIADNDGNSEKFFNFRLNAKMNTPEIASLSPQEKEIKRSIQAELLRKERNAIPSGYYDNLKYKIDIVITGEQIDIARITQTLDTIITMLGQNPAILDDPTIRKMLYKRIDLLGLNPKEWFDEQIKPLAETLQTIRQERGGSIASPQAPMPSMTPTQQTI